MTMKWAIELCSNGQKSTFQREKKTVKKAVVADASALPGKVCIYTI